MAATTAAASWFDVQVTDVARTVYVSNISSRATETNVQSFFSYCGGVALFAMRPDAKAGEGLQHAVVSFQTQSGFTTALLLSTASIVDRPIVVVPFSLDAAAAAADEPEQAPLAPAAATTGDGTAAAAAVAGGAVVAGGAAVGAGVVATGGTKSVTAVLAEMTAAGITVGSTAITRAREYDEASLRLGSRTASAMVSLQTASRSVTSVLDSAMAQFGRKVDAMDERVGLGRLIARTQRGIEALAGNVSERARAMPVVGRGVSLASSAVESTDAVFRDFINHTQAALDSIADGRAAASTTAEATAGDAAVVVPVVVAPSAAQ